MFSIALSQAPRVLGHLGPVVPLEELEGFAAVPAQACIHRLAVLVSKHVPVEPHGGRLEIVRVVCIQPSVEQGPG